MKWIFLAFLAVLVPALAVWSKQNRRHFPKILAVMGFLPFVIAPWHLYVAPVSWPLWSGYVKGIEISLLDALALAVLLGLPRSDRRLPFAVPLLLYLAAILLSAFQSEVPLASLFPAWQFARVMLLIAAVASACSDPRAPLAMIGGMTAGLAFQTVMALKEHVGGAVQAGGSLGHQNMLGMMSHFVVFPAAALLMSGKRNWAAIGGPIAGTFAAILTASRATIGLAGPGYLATILISIVRRPDQRKVVVAIAAIVGLAIAAPLASGALNDRFEAKPLQTDYDERAAFETAAKLIIADHPLGVGANEYVVVVNTQGYAERARIEPTYGSRSANVHNVYLLIAAELGIAGSAALILTMLWPAAVALRAYFQFGASYNNDLLLGLAIAILIIAIHSMFEWIFVMFSAQYLFAICVGLIGGIVRQDARGSYAHKAPRRTMPDWIDAD